MAVRYARLELEDAQGAESTTTGVFATPFYLPSIDIGMNPGPNVLDRSDEQRGTDDLLPVAQNEYTPTGTYEFRAYANYIGALLLLLWGDVTSTAGNGVITDPDGNVIPAGATRHVFSRTQAVKSARLTDSYGDHWYQARGLTLQAMRFALDADGVKVTGDMMANYLSRLTADPGFVPAQDSIDILPFRRRNVQLSWGSGTAHTESIGFAMEQDLEYVRDMGGRTGWPSNTDRNNSPQGNLRVTGDITRRYLDDADWEALIAATSFAATIKAISEQNIGATAFPYKLFVEAPKCQYTGGTVEQLKNQPRHQEQLTWQASHSDAAGYDCKVTLINGVAAYK